jgi:hypothetical protein
LIFGKTYIHGLVVLAFGLDDPEIKEKAMHELMR